MPDVLEPNTTPAATLSAWLVTHPIFRTAAFGTFHPLAITRHAAVLDLCQTLGWLDPDQQRICGMPSRRELERFHSSAYLDALERTARTNSASPEVRDRFGLGTAACPIFPGLWERAAATVGGAILAVDLALAGGVAFHPAGGTHHGRPGRAAGFCYLNDPVFAILRLLDAGLARVLYVDLDAHHGDGVQDAFAADPRVVTVSIHEQGRWPYSGGSEDRGMGRAVNLPVPAGLNDSEFRSLIDAVVLPMADDWAPQAVVVTCGADALAGDPLSAMRLSNAALWGAVLRLVGLARHAVVLGGGGYNPWTVARCWAGLWARLSGQTIPAALPPAAQAYLAGLSCDLVDEEDFEPAWLATIADPPNEGPIRPDITALVRTWSG